MYKLSKSFTFEAAHKLEDYSGKCSRLHGHSMRLTVVFIGKELFNNNILVDYCEIKNLVQPMVDEFLDHFYLNETLDSHNSTSEFIAKWCFDYIELLLTLDKSDFFKQEYAFLRRFDSFDSTAWWRNAMVMRGSMKWLHLGECVEIIIKKYQREARMFDINEKDKIQTSLFDLSDEL